MYDIRREQQRQERAFLVGVSLGGDPVNLIHEQLDELALLADTAGAVVTGRTVQSRPAPDAKFFIGSGKAEEIKAEAERLQADLIIMNDDLSPAQIRNLEKVFERKTLDRSSLILDIFARHARTHEAKVQVELAQMSYMAPRLTGMWEHFGQQTAGMSAGGNRIGTRGPGETQLETDKRRVKKRISELKDKLEEVERQRDEGRKQRAKIFKAALVGYTNVGKSTLLNALCKSQVLVANKLFATLDATTRKVFLADYGEILLSDTVGFIRKLPHHLVASFRSTLSVVTEADLICVIMDASSPHLDEQMEVVNGVLDDLETVKISRITLFNKIDAVEGSPILDRLKSTHPGALFVSALNKTGFEDLKKALTQSAKNCTQYKAAGYLKDYSQPEA